MAARAAVFMVVVITLTSCKDEHARALEGLQKRGVAPTAESVHEQAALGRADVVALLIQAGTDVNQPDKSGLTPAIKAARNKSWPVLSALLPGLSISALNQPDAQGITVLQSALEDQNADLVNQLLDAGASSAALPEKGAPAVEQAITAGKIPLARRLIEGLGDSRVARQRALLAAVKSGDVSLTAHCLAGGADAANPGKNQSPLLLESAHKNPEMARLLIESGASPAKAPGLLRSYAEAGNKEMVRFLLNTGAPPDAAAAVDDATPLTAAITAGHNDIAALLLEAGADAAALTERAISTEAPGLLEFLLDHGLSAQSRDGAGETLLMRAVIGGQPANVKLLMSRGADPEITGIEGQSPLHMAAAINSIPVMEALIMEGADPNATFSNPVSPDFLKRINNEHFEGWLKRDTGLTIMMLAASRGETEMLSFLLSKGAKRNQQTKGWKRYPVQFACDTTHISAAQILLGRNPSTEKRNVRATISLSKQRVTLFKDDAILRGSRVSTGRRGYATPTGKYVITDKQASWTSTIYHSSMPYFMRLSCREFGMHEGVCPGYPASHGCIRMPGGDVRAFFSVMQIGDPVEIIE